MILRTLKGITEDIILPGIPIIVVVCGCLYLFNHWIEAQPVPADTLKLATTESPCIRDSLNTANKNGLVITQGMLDDSSKRCKYVEAQQTAFK